MKRVGSIAAAVILALLLIFTSFHSKQETPDEKAKREFRDALEASIVTASRIEVVEHSYFYDVIYAQGPGADWTHRLKNSGALDASPAN